MLRVMSCNLRYGLAADGDNRWERRRHLALARIRAFLPDLLGLQECRDDDQAACIRAGLADCQMLESSCCGQMAWAQGRARVKSPKRSSLRPAPLSIS